MTSRRVAPSVGMTNFLSFRASEASRGIYGIGRSALTAIAIDPSTRAEAALGRDDITEGRSLGRNDTWGAYFRQLLCVGRSSVWECGWKSVSSGGSAGVGFDDTFELIESRILHGRNQEGLELSVK